MVNRNLSGLPTLQQQYDVIGAIPVAVQLVKSSDGSLVDYSVHPHHALGDLDLKKTTLGLQANIGGNFIISSCVDPKIIDPRSKESPFLYTTIQGANRFTIKTIRSGPWEDKNGWPGVTITTAIAASGTAALLQNISEIAENSNATVVEQNFLRVGKSLETALISNNIISSGFNKIGLAIPAFPDTNALAGALQRLFATSDFVKDDRPLELATIADVGTVLAFWDSWGDGIKAGATLAGGILGGVAGAVTFGAATGGPGAPMGALLGASAGSAICNNLAGALVPNSWY
jgi:hypothetical protein